MPGYDDDELNENGPKALRDALEKANKELKQLREANEKAQAELAKQSLANVLRDKSVPANIQRWIKRDNIDPTPEAVDKWLEENGADFGWKPGGQEASEGATAQEAPAQGAPAPQGVLSESDTEALARMLAAFGGASGVPGMPADKAQAAVENVATQFQFGGYNSASVEDVAKALRDAGIDIEGPLNI